MAKGAGQFDKADGRARRVEGVDNRLRFRRGIKPVGIEADQAEARLRSLEGSGEDAAMIFGQPIVRGNRVLQFFTGGRPGITYVIRCLATTSTGRRVIDEMRIRIYANEGRRARRL